MNNIQIVNFEQKITLIEEQKQLLNIYTTKTE